MNYNKEELDRWWKYIYGTFEMPSNTGMDLDDYIMSKVAGAVGFHRVFRPTIRVPVIILTGGV